MCEVASCATQRLAKPTTNATPEMGEGGVLHVQRSSCEQIVLTCEGCKKKLIVLGPEEEWRSRRPIFVCECGHKLTLDGRADEEVFAAS